VPQPAVTHATCSSIHPPEQRSSHVPAFTIRCVAHATSQRPLFRDAQIHRTRAHVVVRSDSIRCEVTDLSNEACGCKPHCTTARWRAPASPLHTWAHGVALPFGRVGDPHLHKALINLAKLGAFSAGRPLPLQSHCQPLPVPISATAIRVPTHTTATTLPTSITSITV
jgi:hypothetical protein